MNYTLKTSKTFEKDFAKLDSFTQNRVLLVLERMRINPLEDVKKLKAVSVGIFRKRIGDYRLRFDIVKQDIFLYRIRHRKDVYRE